MLKIIFIPFVLLNFIAVGQTTTIDSSKSAISADDDVVYTKVKVTPQPKNGTIVFADNLKKELLKNTSKFKPGKIYFSLIVTKSGDVRDVKRQMNLSEDFPLENQIQQFISNSSGMWIPGYNNSNPLTCMKLLCIEFTKHDLTISE